MIFLFLTAALFAQDGDDPGRHWKSLEKESAEKYRQGLRRALDEATARVAKEPSSSAAHLERGRALARLEREEEALVDLNRALALESSNAEARLALGELYMNRDEHDKARDEFSKAIQLNPKQPRAFLLRGAAQEKLKEYVAAADDYTAALKLDGALSRALVARAGAYEKLKRADEERADCDRVFEQIRGFLTASYPEVIDRIESQRKQDLKKYRESLKAALNKIEAYGTLKAANPELFDKLVRLQTLERAADEVGVRLRASGEGKEEFRRQLRDLVGQIFDLRQELQKRELDALQERIDTVRAAMKDQAKEKVSAVENRVKNIEAGAAPKKKGKDEDRSDK